jgi:hypothetical protein
VNIRWIRGGAIAFFLLFLVAVTWPGMIAGNRIFPLVLGLPLSMVWIASWVVASFLVLVLLDAAEGRTGHPDAGGRPNRPGGNSPGTGPAPASRETGPAEGGVSGEESPSEREV